MTIDIFTFFREMQWLKFIFGPYLTLSVLILRRNYFQKELSVSEWGLIFGGLYSRGLYTGFYSTVIRYAYINEVLIEGIR